jgi:hypothetical protein
VAYLAGQKPFFVVIPLILAAPVLIWRRPYHAVIFLLATAVVIEGFPYKVGTHNGAITSRILWWYPLTHGLILFPVEIFLLLAMVIWILRAGLERSFGLPKSPLLTCLKIFWVLLVLGVVRGLSHGAQLKYDLWEIRPWLYLTVAFVLAAAFLRTRRALDLVLWTIVLGSGVKSLQGTYIYFSYARSMHPRPEAILGHEEAFFFGVFVILTCALWLYDIRGSLRTVATCLLPFVVIADLANTRRTAWLVLAASIVTMLVIAFRTLTYRRHVITAAIVMLAVGSALYLPAYWNHDGTLAQPARAVRSQFGTPDPRDQASNLYRQQEDTNLLLNIKSAGVLGTGFGIPIAYTAQIANISDIDPMIAYIPHNGLLWIWLRIGPQGEIVFWCFCALALVRSCRLAMARDRRLAMLGAVVSCAIISYLIEGYNDVGLSSYRIVAAMGCLLGVMEAATRLAQDRDLSPETDANLPLPAVRKVPPSGSAHVRP